MGYDAAIDREIKIWVKAAGSVLVTSSAGKPARYFHVPGDTPFECFQIAVRAPENGRIAVSARAIDTNDDTDETMDQTWDGPVAQLSEMLRTAMATVETWKTRK
ncbi:MAG: hypothetical protein SGJ23_09515 [Alphaproteobacteria bacterium]|nr:hypothetical protein [Alphaproteobacteria bacterium]